MLDDGSNGSGNGGDDCKTPPKRKRSPSIRSNSSSSSSSGKAEPPRKKQAAAKKAIPSDDADSLWKACRRLVLGSICTLASHCNHCALWSGFSLRNPFFFLPLVRFTLTKVVMVYIY
jgi:hypothetical protein